jgi:hypothetical protein
MAIFSLYDLDPELPPTTVLRIRAADDATFPPRAPVKNGTS